MKKLFCLILALMMFAFIFSSCGKFDIQNEDLTPYVKLGDMTSFSYDEICAAYETYRESQSSTTVSFNATTGFTLDFLLTAEVIAEDGTLTKIESWTHDTDSDYVKGYQMFRKDGNYLFDNSIAYKVSDAGDTASTQRTIEVDKAFSFTMLMDEDCEDATLVGKKVKFTIKVKKALPAVYNDSYVADRLLSFYQAVSTSKDIVAVGDTVTLNYTATVDGKPFDGSSGTSFVIVVGEGDLFAALEEALIGHKNGEKFNATVKLPADFAATDVAGKEAVYSITIKDIYNDSTLITDNTDVADIWEMKYVFRVLSYAEYSLFDIVEERSESIAYPEKLMDEFKGLFESYVKANISDAIAYYASVGETYTKAEMKELLYPDGSDVQYVKESAEAAAFSYMVEVAALKALNLTYTDKDFETDMALMASDYTEYYGEQVTVKDLITDYGEVYLRMTMIRNKLNAALQGNITGAPKIPQSEK